MNVKYLESVNRTCELIEVARAKLPDTLPMPNPDEIRAAVRDIIVSRGPRAGYIKLSQPAGPGRQLWRCLDWHRSSGNLHRPIYDRIIDPGGWDRWDTVAQVIIMLTQHKFTAIENWKRVLGHA